MKKTVILLLFLFFLGCTSMEKLGYRQETAGVYSKYSPQAGITVYTGDFMSYSSNSPNIMIYEKNGVLTPQLIFSLYSTDWAFLETVNLLNSTGERITYNLRSSKEQSEVLTHGSIMEAYKVYPDKKQMLELDKFFNSEKIYFSYSGSRGHFNGQLSPSEISKFKTLIEFYNNKSI